MEDYMIRILTLMEMENLMLTSILYATELEYMDADEIREALEDAGLDPDDYDFD